MSNFELIERIHFDPKHFFASTEYLVKINGPGYKIKVLQSPFTNCQIFSIAPFCTLLKVKTDYENIMSYIRELNEMLSLHKSLCQVDVNQAWFYKIKKYVTTLAEMPYRNLTDSRMIQALIKVN